MVEENPYQATEVAASARPGSGLSLPILFALAIGGPFVVAVGVVFATGTAQRFFWLLEQAAPLYVVAWPVSVPLFVFLFVSHHHLSSTKSLNDRRLLWLAPLPDIAVAMLVLGAVYAGPLGHQYPSWTMDLMPAGLFVAVGVVVLAVVFNVGRRWFVGALGLLLLLFVLACSITAGMSITGDWI
ncbi:hypothetical protein NG895_03780 [Aeoliella sp. ICT_H6.2]|uniref:Uncharacterized protein n=1 Tax=Aeoliella straminimaris TaxID=2954799 RepID=A0A9X2JG06_9BACT|nr:hypothetical protein [Aeoliella straminimaris]MCO6043018.1 hypothetical protein [Aeoliella straminimaris]